MMQKHLSINSERKQKALNESLKSKELLLSKVTEYLFKTTACIYFIWLLIAFYIRPYKITLLDLFMHYTFIISLLVTFGIYAIVKILLNKPQMPVYEYRNIIKPSLAGISIITTCIFVYSFILMLPQISQGMGPSDIESQDVLAVTAQPQTSAPTDNLVSATPAPLTNVSPSPSPETTKAIDPKSAPRVMVQQYNPVNTDFSNSILSNFRIVNVSDVEVDLSKVKFRYYFSNMSDANLKFEVIEAYKGKDKVTSSFKKSKEPNTYYAEIGFSANIGNLSPNHYTEMNVKLTGIDRNQLNQKDDFSFNKQSVSFVYWWWCPVYVSDTLVWGQNPPKKFLD